MVKTKICKICNQKFEIQGQIFNGFFKPNLSPYNIVTCSEECRRKNGLRIAREQAKRKKTQIIKRKCRYCGDKVISNNYCPRSFCDGVSGSCYKSWLSENRKGNKNPAYRNGFSIGANRKYSGIHLKACSKYRKEFLDKNNYLFCEVCGINGNGTPKFEVHHIYFASLHPKHKELHNTKNLIMVCIGCHNNFHSNKLKDVFIKLEKERGLKELFT